MKFWDRQFCKVFSPLQVVILGFRKTYQIISILETGFTEFKGFHTFPLKEDLNGRFSCNRRIASKSEND
jgi:hypothetical protein